MECYEYEKLFERYFDHEITILEYKAVRSHLGRCPKCREAFLDHQFALDFLSAMPLDEPSENLGDQIIGKISEKKGNRQWSHWIVGIAACFLFALTLTAIEQNTAGDEAKATLLSSSVQTHSGKEQIILPKDSILKGDLYTKGNVVIYGKVYGSLRADRIILVKPVQESSDVLSIIGKKFKSIFGKR